MKALLSSTYFGPIQWYQKLNRYDECLIERHESFIKQTYRNRMIIPTTNGPLSLTIPTNHDTSLAMKDIRISDHANWRHVHWNALLFGLWREPFLRVLSGRYPPLLREEIRVPLRFQHGDYREDDRAPRHPSRRFQITEAYIQSKELKEEDEIKDFRDAIRPKKPLPDAEFAPKRYYQVYGQKHGFLPNMSILDLLFNEGNEAIFYL